MKKIIFFSVYIFVLNIAGLAQKKILSNAQDYLTDWTRIDGNCSDISPNGKFIHYCIAGDLTGRMVIISTLTKKEDTILNVCEIPRYTKDSRYLFFRKFGDTVAKYDLIKKSFSYIGNVSGWRIVQAGAHEFLILTTNDGKFRVDNITAGNSLVINGVKSHTFSGDFSTVAIVTNEGLSLVSLADFQRRPVSVITAVSTITFDPLSTRLFFYGQDKVRTAYVYDIRSDKLTSLFDETDPHITEGYSMGSSQPTFTPDGRNLVFLFQKKEEVLIGEHNKEIPKMEIWHHKEIIHAREFIHFNSSIAYINLEEPNAKLNTIASGYVKLIETTTDPNRDGLHTNNSFLFVIVNHEAQDRLYYNRDRMPDFLMYSIQDRKSIQFIPKSHFVSSQQIFFSPTRRFVSWYDTETKDVFCFDIVTRKLANATRKIEVPNDMVAQVNGSVPYRLNWVFAQWLKDDKWFVIRDKFDIWQVDPRGAEAPINLTGGYGRQNKIEFRNIHEEITSKELNNGGKLFVVGLDENKKNGFASIILGSNKGLKVAGFSDKLFYWTDCETVSGSAIFKRAKLTNEYLVVGQRADESPNLYSTKDFKTFNKLSNIHPERDYLWHTSTLIKYPMQGGKTGEGILYKPENFDPNKKYPVLFTYYQERNHNLHCFQDPFPDVNINIPCYVSNGYLVFVPDIINDEPGKIARTTVNSVKSAADYLKQFPWFDYSKMGIQGQSFGGYETNLLVANTNIFAAAQASDAPSSQTSIGQFFEWSSYAFSERGQPNLNTTLWENPEVYIENSPIYQANKVTTPLLLLHGPNDRNVHINQGESMYYSLKRLNKPVWLILYEGGDHANFGEGNGRQDFNIRRQQFFDHYLKGKPMPSWMKQETLSLDVDNEELSNK